LGQATRSRSIALFSTRRRATARGNAVSGCRASRARTRRRASGRHGARVPACIGTECARGVIARRRALRLARRDSAHFDHAGRPDASLARGPVRRAPPRLRGPWRRPRAAHARTSRAPRAGSPCANQAGDSPPGTDAPSSEAFRNPSPSPRWRLVSGGAARPPPDNAVARCRVLSAHLRVKFVRYTRVR
jgi:hypothetical protein